MKTPLLENPKVTYSASVLIASLALTGQSSLANPAEPQPPRPNILYLYVDDLGWGSIGPNGQAERKANGKPYVLTPNIDKLAATGVNFRRGYGCTVCSPARSSQQTGFHQGYTFADRNDPNNGKKAIRKDDITMGDVLAKAGYATGYWGKWGYGGSKKKKSPTLDNLQTLPTSHGYQHVVAELHHMRAHTFFQPTLWTAPAPEGTKGGLILKPNSMGPYQNKKNYSNYPAAQNHPDYPEVAYCDDVYAFAALDFVRKQAQVYNKTGQPFFGLFAAQIPHAPFAEVSKLPNWDQDYKDKPFFASLSKQSQQWCAMVTRIDAHFGNLIQALEDPNGDGDKSDSVIDNTLIVFQSDNGGPNGHNRTELNANGGLTGGKGSIREGGIRVPTVLSWPAQLHQTSQLRAGTNSDRVLDCTDLLPTFAELAGAEIPLGLSGVSIAPLLTSRKGQRNRKFIIHEAGGKVSIIQGNYKLIRSRKNPLTKVENKKAQLKMELYDLEATPAETKNLASRQPELVEKLDSLLTAERVDEPKGFANSYHEWKGAKGSSLAEAENWSVYIYQNRGVEHINKGGVPEVSWTATIADGEALADKDVSFLGLDVAGKLTVSSSATVNARNELRVSHSGELVLDGGTLSSAQWVDIKPGAKLSGNGTLSTDLYTRGTLALSSKGLIIDGVAHLGGTLTVTDEADASGKSGLPILKANSINGRFDNQTVSFSGRKYEISYSKKAVILTPK